VRPVKQSISDIAVPLCHIVRWAARRSRELDNAKLTKIVAFSDMDDASYKTYLISPLKEKFSIHVTGVTTTNRKGAA
jgi:hypothetical protein